MTRRRRRRRHGALDTFLVLALLVLAVLSALAWLAEHLAVLAGVALLMWGAYYLGRRQARPGQVQPPRVWPEEPAAVPAVATATVPVATVPVPGTGSDWCEPDTRQQPSLPADRDSLLADPLSGAHPIGRP